VRRQFLLVAVGARPRVLSAEILDVLTPFAVALIATRIVAGHLPNRFGGARVALYCLCIQAVELALIGTAGAAWVAIVGAAIAGAGFSLVFPSLGLEAVRRVPIAGSPWALTTRSST
jgi:MFS family permease